MSRWIRRAPDRLLGAVAQRWRARGRSSLRQLGLLLLVNLGALGVLEGIARLVPDPWDDPRTADGRTAPAHTLMIPDPTRLWRMQEGEHTANGVTVRIDSDGFRLPAVEGPADAPLLVTLGDSSVFSHGVADGETLHDQLQADLAAAGIPARVACGATPGYSSLQTRIFLDEAGWARHPKLLVIANLWSDNDFEAFRDADLLGLSRDPTSTAVRTLSESALFRLVRFGVLTAAGQPTALKIKWPEKASIGYRRVPIADYAYNLQTLLDEARDHGTGAIFLTLSNVELVKYGANKHADWEPYIQVQRELAERGHVPIVDTTTIFRATGMETSALFLDKMHPTAPGHALIAKALTDALTSAGWPANPLLPVADPSPLALPTDTSDGHRLRDPHSLQETMVKQLEGDIVPEAPGGTTSDGSRPPGPAPSPP